MAVVAPILAVALAAAGTGVAAYSAVQQGENQKKAADFNAAVARNNALASQQQSAFEAAQIRRRNTILAGRQRAEVGKSGVDISGSASDVMNDSSVQGELAAMAALYTGQVQTNREQSQSQLLTAQGENAQTSGYWNAGSTILSGSAGALGNYYNIQNRLDQPQFRRTPNTSVENV